MFEIVFYPGTITDVLCDWVKPSALFVVASQPGKCAKFGPVNISVCIYFCFLWPEGVLRSQ